MSELAFFVLMVVGFTLPVVVMRFGKEWLVALLPIYLITANVFADAFFSLFGITTSLAVPVYAACFVVTDLLSEFYSKHDARRAVFAGFVGQMFFLLCLWLVISSPVMKSDVYASTFSLLPRLIMGSFVAYLLSNLLDIHIFHWIRQKTGARLLWMRNNVSTIISQAVDSTIFLAIAFWGVPPVDTPLKWAWFLLSVWMVKVIVAAFDTIALYAARSLYFGEGNA